MNQNILIRDAEPSDQVIWTEMWMAYRNGKASPEVTNSTWARIIDPCIPVHAMLAISGNKVIGFCNFVEKIDTWHVKPVCHLSDLYVLESARGKGIAGMIIQQLREKMASRGFGAIIWETGSDNIPAQNVYRHFCEPRDWKCYELAL
jgi:GNAT superfamily N-acetyltransferase